MCVKWKSQHGLISPCVQHSQAALCCSALRGRFLPGPIVLDRISASTMDVEDLIFLEGRPWGQAIFITLTQGRGQQARTQRTWPGSESGGRTVLCSGLLVMTSATVSCLQQAHPSSSLKSRNYKRKPRTCRNLKMLLSCERCRVKSLLWIRNRSLLPIGC